MKLSQIVATDMFLPPEWDRDVNHIVTDSRDVAAGDLFIARAGSGEHGEKYIDAALAAGAAAVVADGDMAFRCATGGVPVFTTPGVRAALSQWLSRRYRNAADVQLIGVTGTNGKSSVTQYCAQLLAAMNSACGVIGTLGNGLWPDLQPTRNTTPDICLSYRLLDELGVQGAAAAALEVSSHGLHQGRVAGLQFAVAVLTNVTQDHLDYHGDMEAYFAAKAQLFTSGIAASAVINIDDSYGRRLWNSEARPEHAISVGRSDGAMLRYSDVQFTAQGMTAVLNSPWGSLSLNVGLIGEFNIANTVAAIAALTMLGHDFSALVKAAGKLQPVAGRMELYIAPEKPLAVIDFAHTPDALSNVIAAVGNAGREVTVVFGCGGDRDRSKRPLMVQAVANAMRVWVADDNPRTENPEQIFADIRQAEASRNFTFEHERSAAISAAVAATPQDGIVVIAGKGHETYQEILGVRHSYSDDSALRALGYRKAGGDHVA